MLSACNYFRKPLSVVLFCSCSWLLTGCQTVSKPSLKSLPPGKKIKLEVKGKAGEIRKTRYHSHSYIKEFELDQITKEKDEIVDFTVVESVKASKKPGHIRVDITSKEKDGIVNLHDLAFPEVDEVIPYVYDPQGNVLLAGEYPPESIFYVPPIPLPEGELEVGDTWEKSSEWISLKNAIPLKVTIVGILKNLYECAEDTCADIEVSGEVQVLGLKKDQASFSSEISGRIIYNIKKGVPLWSQVKSTEDLRLAGHRTLVKGCVVSKLTSPEKMTEMLKLTEKLDCQPKAEGIDVPL